ncbi:MAG: hypothetical protein HRT52_11350 [Colwellia sp.]|nr:hypothetical protein [Colwellia sp.]
MFRQQAIRSFKIENDGKCTFSGHQEFQLGINSRVGWFGCWLVLMPVNKGRNKAFKYQFLFKNSVSSQSYSRISRIIKRLKYHARKVD